MKRRDLIGTLCAGAASLHAAAALPRAAGPLEIILPDGTRTGPSKYAGKVVCVSFILTSCSHCQELAQRMSILHRELGPKGFQPLGAAFNDGAMMLLPDFVRRYGVSYPVGVVGRDPMLAFLQYSSMARLMVPQLAFIDRRGAIRFQSNEQNDEALHADGNLRRHIELLLNEGAAAPKPAAKGTPRK